MINCVRHQNKARECNMVAKYGKMRYPTPKSLGSFTPPLLVTIEPDFDHNMSKKSRISI